jgi:hypothetical protein
LIHLALDQNPRIFMSTAITLSNNVALRSHLSFLRIIQSSYFAIFFFSSFWWLDDVPGPALPAGARNQTALPGESAKGWLSFHIYRFIAINSLFTSSIKHQEMLQLFLVNLRPVLQT